VRISARIGAARSAAAFAARAAIPEHNWGKYYLGGGPPVSDRLYPWPFSQYFNAAVVLRIEVIVATTRSTEIVPN
jgi:hypothetical protein